jgi:hypothetical protein
VIRTRHRSLHLPSALALLALLVAAAGCVSSTATSGAAPRPRKPSPITQVPEPDSITVGLWHLDETGGTLVADAGPFRLEGTAGIDTRTEFGRVRNARRFTSSVESFVMVPYSPAMEAGSGLTVETWIQLQSYGTYEDTPIALRWTPQTDQQSWLFGVVGQRLAPPYTSVASPGWHAALVTNAQRGQLLFAFQPGPASPPVGYVSSQIIPLGTWVHVGVTYDGSTVRFYIDGQPDAQYASRGAIRHGTAPLMIGNALDPRALSSFGGDLRADRVLDRRPYYALDGSLDELRISSAARVRVSPLR